MNFKYIIAVKNYSTILSKVVSIKDIAYKPFENKSEIAFFHYRLKSWDIKRKFIVVRTPKESINPQLNIFENKEYEYKILVTIRTFRERFLLIPAELIKRSRQFILKLPRDFIYKEKMKSIELQLA